MTTDRTRKLTCAAVCLALAYILPFLTFGVQAAGQVLCFMHIPVLLAGILCGWQWGLLVGATAPLLRHLTLQMPPFPTAGFMAVELAVYGLVAGVLYRLLPKKVWSVYPALVGAMLAGRAASGVFKALFYLRKPDAYSFRLFLIESFVTSLPGIAIQILLIPVIVLSLQRSHLFPDKAA